MSWPSRVDMATSLFSRLTSTSAVAGFLRRVFSMPCAQKPHTRPYTFISMVPAFAEATANTARIVRMIFFMEVAPESEIDHGHGLKLAVISDARLHPRAAFEESQEKRPFAAVVNAAGVVTALHHEPGGQRVEVVFVRGDAQLQRVDAMGELGRLMQVGLERRID